MLKTRVITGALLGLTLLAALFLLPSRWAIGGFGIVFTIGAWEWAGFGGIHAPAPRIAYTLAVVLLLVLASTLPGRSPQAGWVLLAGCVWWGIAFLWLCLAPERQRPFVTLLCGIPVLVPAFLALATLLGVRRGFATGPQLVLWLLIFVTGSDIGAFFAGRRFGRLKLAPRVSPAKTWEGAVGGLAMVIALAWLGALLFALPVLATVGFGAAVGIISIVGDLTESMFKRAVGLKDSGKLLPGHGGMLDRIDSVTAAAPLYALGLLGSGWLA
jgi:phosphatidate cytidylyltransferase